MFRTEGNFMVSPNKLLRLILMMGIDKIFYKCFSLQEISEKINCIPIIGQILTVLYYVIIPIGLKMFISIIPEDIIRFCISCYGYTEWYLYVYIIVLIFDLCVFHLKKRKDEDRMNKFNKNRQ